MTNSEIRQMTAPHDLSLPPAVSGARHEFVGRSGKLSYYTRGGDGVSDDAGMVPLLLVHSINAAGSAYEMRPLYEH